MGEEKDSIVNAKLMNSKKLHIYARNLYTSNKMTFAVFVRISDIETSLTMKIIYSALYIFGAVAIVSLFCIVYRTIMNKR